MNAYPFSTELNLPLTATIGPKQKQTIFILKDGSTYQHRRMVWNSDQQGTYRKRR